jgi:hypothetical protein
MPLPALAAESNAVLDSSRSQRRTVTPFWPFSSMRLKDSPSTATACFATDSNAKPADPGESFSQRGSAPFALMGSARRVESELETRVQTLRKLERQAAQRANTPVGLLAAIRSLRTEAEAELKLARSTD